MITFKPREIYPVFMHEHRTLSSTHKLTYVKDFISHTEPIGARSSECGFGHQCNPGGCDCLIIDEAIWIHTCTRAKHAKALARLFCARSRC